MCDQVRLPRRCVQRRRSVSPDGSREDECACGGRGHSTAPETQGCDPALLTARGEKSPLSPEECQMLRSGATVVASLLPRGQSIEAARCARAAEAARARAAAAAADQSAADKASESGAERRSKACEKKKMPTALSVIHRFQWGAVADAASRVAVGFVDRLAAGGVSERPLAAFECWGEAVCSVGEEALAIPQHRIQYFKFDGEVVWEKATGLDLVSERVNAAAAAAA